MKSKNLSRHGITDKREEPFAERLQLLDADGANGRRNGFAPGFVDFLNVKVSNGMMLFQLVVLARQ